MLKVGKILSRLYSHRQIFVFSTKILTIFPCDFFPYRNYLFVLFSSLNVIFGERLEMKKYDFISAEFLSQDFVSFCT